MSGEPVEAAEDTSGVKVGVRVGEEVVNVHVGGEANVHVGLEAGDGTGAAVGAGVADAEVRVGVADAAGEADVRVGGEADKWPRVGEGTEDTAGQT